jgi:hypothetical protein
MLGHFLLHSKYDPISRTWVHREQLNFDSLCTLYSVFVTVNPTHSFRVVSVNSMNYVATPRDSALCRVFCKYRNYQKMFPAFQNHQWWHGLDILTWFLQNSI